MSWPKLPLVASYAGFSSALITIPVQNLHRASHASEPTLQSMHECHQSLRDCWIYGEVIAHSIRARVDIAILHLSRRRGADTKKLTTSSYTRY